MKLTTLAMAVAATMALGHAAQARTYHRPHAYRHHGYRQEARRHAFAHEHWASRHHRRRWSTEARYDSPRRHHHEWLTETPNEGLRAYRRQWVTQARRDMPRRDSRHWTTEAQFDSPRRGSFGGRPSAWCGWEMRQLVSSDPGPSYNLARNWAHWGHAGPAGVGAVVVWPHHVGKIVGRDGNSWVIESGNDGHRLRTRPRSIGGAIAIRWG
jgi:hypothetical protein